MRYHIERIIEIKNSLKKQISIIDDISDQYFRMICMFSILDCFSQEYANYQIKSSQKAFSEFIIKFQTSTSYLECIDPVTLYYDFEDKLHNAFTLDILEVGCIYYLENLKDVISSDDMIAYLKQKGVSDKSICKHKYINLLYKLRSKLVHELSSPSSMQRDTEWEDEIVPHFYHCERLYNVEGKVNNDDVWLLEFPVEFIRKLLIECTTNYLNWCQENKQDPFKNNCFNRKFRIAWVD